ncbi:MAG: SH3 domain-containing protein [Anaerolineae bacterium]|nr:SH3 domain-containing protein [Anaerolineae bacterium]
MSFQHRVRHVFASRLNRDHVIAGVVAAAVLLAASLNTSAIWASNPLQTSVSSPTFATDSRVSPSAGDRVAVYCNANGTIGVLGITNTGQGIGLLTFSGAEIVGSISGTVVKSVEPNGSVSLRGDNQWNFQVAWFGGPYGATGSGNFAKSFSCNLSGVINLSSAGTTTKPTTNQVTTTTVSTGLTLQATGTLRVRSGPSTTCPQIGVIMPGTAYTVLAKSRGGLWLQIANANNQTGWVSAGFTRVSSTQLLRSAPTLNVSCTGSLLP